MASIPSRRRLASHSARIALGLTSDPPPVRLCSSYTLPNLVATMILSAVACGRAAERQSGQAWPMIRSEWPLPIARTQQIDEMPDVFDRHPGAHSRSSHYDH